MFIDVNGYDVTFPLSPIPISDLQNGLDLGRDVGLLVQLDALLLGSTRALHCDLLQVGQHHTVSLGHCLEFIEQELQQFQQQPAEGARESRKTKNVRRWRGGWGDMRTWSPDMKSWEEGGHRGNISIKLYFDSGLISSLYGFVFII